MRSVVRGLLSWVSAFGLLGCLLLAFACLGACSIPNLEEPDCLQARDVVREFYSFHFGNDMAYSVENLEKRKKFLAPVFFESLRNSTPSSDPFTRTSDVPKAFRVGECRVIEPARRVSFNVLLFWKTDTRTEQRAIAVETQSVDGKWLIDSIDDASNF